MSLPPRLTRWAVLTAVLTVAAILRFVGLRFGFPALTHADEPQVIMVAVNAAMGDLSPGFFAYPALFPTISGLVLRLWVLLQPGVWADFQAFFDAYCSDPTPAYLLVRGCSAAAGVAAVGATAWLGHRAAGARVGLLAAAMLAVNTYAVRDSHFAVTDTATSLVAALALVAILALLDGRRWRPVLLAGCAVGLAAATKYPAGALGIALLAALAMGSRGGWSTRLRWLGLAGLVAALCALTAFLVTNPYIVLDFDTFQADMAREYARRVTADPEAFGYPAWRWYLQRTLPSSFGWGGLALVTLGAAWGLWVRNHAVVVLALGAGSILAPAFGVVSVGERYLLPAYPALAVLGAWAAVRLTRRVRPRGRWLAHTVFASLVAALVLPPLGRSVRLSQLLTLPDTRVLAARWFEDHAQRGDRVALEWAYVPALDPEHYQLTSLDYPEGGPAEVDADYIVVSSYAFNRYFMAPERHAREVAFLQALEAGAEPAARFSGQPPERAYTYIERVPPGPLDQQGMIGPEIRIYGPFPKDGGP